MVATPWGDSQQLQERRLSPGPGTPREEVEENQRTRIYAAMVASTAQIGYGSTGVAEISEISGVSTRTFYNLFPGGKEECFLTVLEQILAGTVAALSVAGEDEDDWERRLAAIYHRFAQMVSTQPATARLVLIEAYAAGPASSAALDRATGEFERLSRKRLAESPERADLPPAMVEALVGGLQELARTRLRRGEAAALPDLVPELVELTASYRPPPERLRPGSRRPVVEADGIASSEEAERAIRGFILAVAEHGYSAATIHQIARLGSMSPNTFYANFRDKREALLAAIDSSMAQMQAVAMAAYRRNVGWASGVRAAIGSALGFLAARPATAKLLLEEVYAGGPEALRLRTAGFRQLLSIVEERGGQGLGVPAIAPEAIFGGIVALTRRQFLRKGPEGLPSLAPIATYIALAPYVGADEACAAANGDARSRTDATAPEESPVERSSAAINWVIVGVLGSRWDTVEGLASELGATEEAVLKALEELRELGIVEELPSRTGGPSEWTNIKKFRLIDDEEWAKLPPRERRELADGAARMVIRDLDEAIRRGCLGARLDEHYTRIAVALDQEGWTELAAIHLGAFRATEAVREKSRQRMRESGEQAIEGSSIQVLVELPVEELRDS